MAECPVEKVTGLACADGQVARSHIEEMQRVGRAEGNALSDRGLCLDDDKPKRLLDLSQARDRRRNACEAATDDANCGACEEGRFRVQFADGTIFMPIQ